MNNLEDYNFIKVCKNEVLIHNISDEDIYIYVLDSMSCYIFDVKDILVNNNTNFRNRFVYDPLIPKTIYNSDCIRFTKYSRDSLVFPFFTENNPYKDLPRFNDYIYFFKEHQFRSANFITQLERENGKYYMVTYVNATIVKRALLTYTQRDYRVNMFIDILSTNIKKQKTIECNQVLDTILNNVAVALPDHQNHQNQFNLLKDSVKLYNYQKNDIYWMDSIKDKIDNESNIITVDYNEYNHITLNNVEYLLYNNRLRVNNECDNDLNTYKLELKYYGGHIISQVGLGKTIIVLYHILKNSNNIFDQFVDFEMNLCNYFFKRGKNRSEHCLKNKINPLYCKEHSTTLFIDKRHTVLKNLEYFNIEDYIIDDKNNMFFKTNASLIICPNQLCDQWVREYYDKFSIEKRILLIVTADQYNNLTFSDILFADIIVISYNFLTNQNYLKTAVKNKMLKYETIHDLNTNQLLSSRDNILKLFHNFSYEGIYLDESHELNIRNDILNTSISRLNSKYKWTISATPFSNGLKSFSSDMYHTVQRNQFYELNKNILEQFVPLYRRNTKESIINEFNGNIITNTVKLLDFTKQERTIYDAHVQGNIKTNRNFLIKLCCDTSIDLETRKLVKNCKTFDEIQNVILNHNKKKLTTLSSKMNDCTEMLNKLLYVVERGFIIDEVNQYNIVFENIEEVKGEISILKRKITIDKKEYDTINRTYVYLKNAIATLKQTDTCPICLDDIEDDIAITKCGHKFCKDCIYEYVEQITRDANTKCPKCNVAISVSDIYVLMQEDNIQQDIGEIGRDNLKQLIQKVKSTKIGNIIYYIQNELKSNDKCIIFSQWDSLLTKIGTILTNEKINVLYCSGTVYQRKRSINNFQSDPTANIICLSSENCASGVNLTSANKIILIEPVYGKKEYRKDIENQAIGRADRIGQKRPVEIIRFIIKDSIEQDILNENGIDEVDLELERDDILVI